VGEEFSHPGEAKVAALLDRFHVRWQYEPQTFAVRWWPDGSVAEWFTPDFYLPDVDAFVELATPKDSLVRRKARKVRLLREVHPELRIVLYEVTAFSAAVLNHQGAAAAIGALGTDLAGLLPSSTQSENGVDVRA
jgi:hypothetical protein